VSGLGSTLTASSTAEIDGGSLNVTAGGVVQNADDGFVGVSSAVGTFSTATVSGAGSQWINSDLLFVAFEKDGTLDITAGGKVQSRIGIVARVGSAVGVVTVSGAGSQWNNSSDLIVGKFGSGTLNVTGGGSVSSTDGYIGQETVSDGTATITGGAWTMTGRLSVGGDANAGIAGGPGTLNVQPAGTVSAAQGVVLFPDAHMNLQGGTLDASSISYHQGIQESQFQWSSGTLHVGTFNGSLTNSGGALAPGHSAGSTTINGNYTQATGGVLEIEIGGPLAGSQFDFVNVTGSAQVGGELDLTLTGGFTPTPAQTFAILISNGLSGAFDNAPSGQRVTTSDGGGSFLVNYGFGSPFDDNQIVLSNFLAGAGLLGDYNQNGTVDAADYALWRNTLGQIGSGLAADGNGSGTIDAGDYAVWRANFGQTAGSGSALGAAGSTAVVPEPSALLLCAFAAPLLFLRGRRLDSIQTPSSSHP
jgi:T5SS/PEP-CTERM-associated repeat protein